MGEASASLPVPELPRDLEGLTAAQNNLLAEVRAQIAVMQRKLRVAGMTQGELLEFLMAVDRLADLEKVMLAVDAKLADAMVLKPLRRMRDEQLAGLEPAPVVPVPRRRRHVARPRAQHPLMRSVP